MIFVTVGTQKFPFDRLLIELDRLVKNDFITDEIIAQRGHSKYIPANYQSCDFLSSDEIAKHYNRCSLLLTHAGTSSIIEGLKRKKKIIVVPRQKRYGEHVDNHQLEITEAFVSQNLVAAVYDISQLGSALQTIGSQAFKQYPFGSRQLVESVTEYLSEIAVGRERA